MTFYFSIRYQFVQLFTAVCHPIGTKIILSFFFLLWWVELIADTKKNRVLVTDKTHFSNFLEGVLALNISRGIVSLSSHG